jgi:thiamine pyridinylase
MRRLTVLFLPLAFVALACATTESARTLGVEPLRVALFGWIPNAADDNFAALEAHIENAYAKRAGRAVDVEFRFDEFYDPVGLYKLFDSYDVVEMDAVMLGLAVDEGFLHTWPKVPKRNWHPAAIHASTVEGTEYGIPHWLCSFFVFTRSDAVARETSLDGLVSSVAALDTAEPDISGVLDGSWDSTTMYLSGWLDQGNVSMDDALSKPPDPDVLRGFSKLGAGCVAGGESPCTNYAYSSAACLETGLFDEAYCYSTSVDPPT